MFCTGRFPASCSGSARQPSGYCPGETWPSGNSFAVFKGKCARPRLRATDRLFWVCLSKTWKDRRPALMKARDGCVLVSPGLSSVLDPEVQAEERTPEVSRAIRRLIRKMAAANLLWAAPRIHAELLKLGLQISECSVSRLLPSCRLRPGGPSSTNRPYQKSRPH